MGANPKQAIGVTLFLLAFTVLAGGIFKESVLLYLVAAVLLAGSTAVFLKAKPLEHKES